MAGLNKAQLIGYVGRDPEMRFGRETGKPYCRFSLATSTGGENGETEWHNIVAFDRLAEVADQFLRKGSLVYVEGRIRSRKYRDAEGVTRYLSEILVRYLQLLDRKNRDAAPPDAAGSPADEAAMGGTLEGDPFADDAGLPVYDGDDIPF